MLSLEKVTIFHNEGNTTIERAAGDSHPAFVQKINDTFSKLNACYKYPTISLGTHQPPLFLPLFPTIFSAFLVLHPHDTLLPEDLMNRLDESLGAVFHPLFCDGDFCCFFLPLFCCFKAPY